MAKARPIKTLIIERVKKSKSAQQKIVEHAAMHGVTLDPNDWQAILKYLMDFMALLLPLILKFI